MGPSAHLFEQSLCFLLLLESQAHYENMFYQFGKPNCVGSSVTSPPLTGPTLLGTLDFKLISPLISRAMVRLSGRNARPAPACRWNGPSLLCRRTTHMSCLRSGTCSFPYSPRFKVEGHRVGGRGGSRLGKGRVDADHKGRAPWRTL